jgi:hypothetical protein
MILLLYENHYHVIKIVPLVLMLGAEPFVTMIKYGVDDEEVLEPVVQLNLH